MIKRKFNKTFDEMLQQAYLFHDGYVVDESSFTAASPLFDLTFAADFLADIVAADALPTNESDLNQQTVLTEEVEDEMTAARDHYQKLLLYVNLAWPNNKSKLKIFGNSQYLKSRNSTLRLINLMQDAHSVADSATYKAALIAVGFAQTDIDLLNTLATGLTTKNRTQESFMNMSSERSETRTVAFNTVWDTMVRISDTSKIIFKDSPAKIDYYLLYHATHSGLSKPQNVTAVLDAVDPLKVNIDFDPVPDALEYHLYRSLVTVGDPSGTFTDEATSATNHFDAPLTTGKRNYWKVKAYNDTESSSAYSDEVWLDA